jgi:hypothetical protein
MLVSISDAQNRDFLSCVKQLCRFQSLTKDLLNNITVLIDTVCCGPTAYNPKQDDLSFPSLAVHALHSTPHTTSKQPQRIIAYGGAAGILRIHLYSSNTL